MPFSYGYWIDPPRCGEFCPHETKCFKWQKHLWKNTPHFYPDCSICTVRQL